MGTVRKTEDLHNILIARFWHKKKMGIIITEGVRETVNLAIGHSFQIWSHGKITKTEGCPRFTQRSSWQGLGNGFASEVDPIWGFPDDSAVKDST